jgi:cell filamentation protein, protein adenylyltransferase
LKTKQLYADAEVREYQRTHPHISFSLDLRRPLPSLWILLGEAKSKAQHVARTLLAPDRAHELMVVYLTKGALATTAIEGNTLSEDEARKVVEDASELPPSKEYLAREIRNIIVAYNTIKDELLQDPSIKVSPQRLNRYNAMILDGLQVEGHVVPGETRRTGVVVGNVYKAPDHQDCDYLLSRLCEWLNGPDFEAPRSSPEYRAPLAIIKAMVAHLYLAWIHPYGDGNGRTARLLELELLLAAGFPPPVTQLLSNHYNATRTEYYRRLKRASQTGDVIDFLTYAARGLVDELTEQLDIVWRWQFDDRWEQYVYQRFGELRTETNRRRLRLTLELSKRHPEPVARAEVPLLDPRLAHAYAQKTPKTLTRDLNAIRKLGLIERATRGYRAKKDIIRGFQSERIDGVLEKESMSLVQREPARANAASVRVSVDTSASV